ncbi:zinc finger CCCH domain-containing protein 20 [Cocos nucifera]|uniref:Zinc finger CCCH domain-containing protein 20 n=1 Tax=Cocos nucifera TaxID=13894 RepID=A0A8K0IB57_COCNU|nr:zinc finger CCCH domain-containing protein 20 [Cocos nucifera]
MAFGEGNHHHPTVQVPPWTMFDDPTAGMQLSFPVSGVTGEAVLAALQRFLPSNNEPLDDSDGPLDSALDVFSCDEFRMYEFKVRRCPRGRSHDWTECPYAHPGEKARRRDPRRFHYSGVACTEFRKTGRCERGDACDLAHGVFESWLHPTRYRTQFCKDGTACRRRVCFFAHTPNQLRVLPQSSRSPPQPAPESYDGSPARRSKNLISSPRSTLISPSISPTSESPPVSPVGEQAVNEVLTAIRKLQLSKAKSVPCSWRVGMVGGGGLGSPRGVGAFRAGFASLPSTPTAAGGGGLVCAEETDKDGRGMRGRLFEVLGEEEAVGGCSDAGGGSAAVPDLGWISELVK